MKWYENAKLLSSAIALAVTIGALVAVFVDKVDQFMEVAPWLGTMIGGGALGFAVRGSGSGAGAGKVAPAILAMLIVSVTGCGWGVQDWATKAQSTLRREVSPRIEEKIEAECGKRAKACIAAGVPQQNCGPLAECMGWAAKYVAATRSVHMGLSALVDLWEAFGSTASQPPSISDSPEPPTDVAPAEPQSTPIGSRWTAYRLQGVLP